MGHEQRVSVARRQLDSERPTLPPPPGRLSSSSGCFTLSDSFCPTRRISTSALPPGVNGFTMVIGRDGK
jgi:hypothetical protein